jgi:hypothetical protein
LLELKSQDDLAEHQQKFIDFIASNFVATLLLMAQANYQISKKIISAADVEALIHRDYISAYQAMTYFLPTVQLIFAKLNSITITKSIAGVSNLKEFCNAMQQVQQADLIYEWLLAIYKKLQACDAAAVDPGVLRIAAAIKQLGLPVPAALDDLTGSDKSPDAGGAAYSDDEDLGAASRNTSFCLTDGSGRSVGSNSRDGSGISTRSNSLDGSGIGARSDSPDSYETLTDGCAGGASPEYASYYLPNADRGRGDGSPNTGDAAADPKDVLDVSTSPSIRATNLTKELARIEASLRNALTR